jgi:hypothetical protein
MTKTLMLTAVAAVAVIGIGAYAVSLPADAQDAPGIVQGDSPQGGWRTGEDGHRDFDKDGWRHHGWRHRLQHDRMMARNRDNGLFFPVADKALTQADVQVLAEAMLLRHGNHTWKVADVAQNQDNTVSFAFTTAEGGVVARFAIETQTGHLRRVG